MAFGCIYGGECIGCMRCQEENEPEEKKCCPECGADLDGENFCYECGWSEEDED